MGVRSQGLSSRVLDICIDFHEVTISPYIVKEVKTKLNEKIKISKEELARVLNFLDSEMSIVKPAGKKPSVCRDKADNNIIHVAEHIDAGLIVTGAGDLLQLKEYSGTKIITPRHFMDHFHQT